MQRAPLLLSIATLASLGCATSPAAIRELPDISMAGLTVADAADPSGWTTLDPTAAISAPIASASSRPAAASQGSGHITLMGGQRWMDDDWDPLDEPAAFGLEFDQTNPFSGHGYEVGVLYTNDDDDLFTLPIIGTVEAEETTYELYGGYRHTFNADESGLHPFVSAGINVLYGELELSAPGASTDDDDTVFGAYARAGLLWDIGERLRLGLDYRYLLTEDLEVFDTDFDSSYGQAMLSLGWAF